jgi:magnesium-protoporphyrin O-methyltransferase
MDGREIFTPRARAKFPRCMDRLVSPPCNATRRFSNTELAYRRDHIAEVDYRLFDSGYQPRELLHSHRSLAFASTSSGAALSSKLYFASAVMDAFVSSALPVVGARGAAASRSLICGTPVVTASSSLSSRVSMAVAPVDDKAVVKEYFNNTGFDRWNRIYSEEGEVNKVQLDIRTGHAVTVDKVLAWIDEDGDAGGMTFADAGCGVGSLSIPLAQRGGIVYATDISQAMVDEAGVRATTVLGSEDAAKQCTFAVSDLEDLTGAYDTVCCIDVMIHYPTDKAADMIGHLTSLSTRRVIITFAPKTFLLSILKKVGEFFPGPSKATRAYLHAESDVVAALEKNGWAVKRTDFSGSRFYFSRILEAVKNN